MATRRVVGAIAPVSLARTAGVVIALLCSFFYAAPAGAQHRVFLPGAILWWTWDPAPLASAPADALIPDQLESQLTSTLLRAATAAGVVKEGPQADALRAVLAASELLSIPHTFAVFRLEEIPANAIRDPGTMRIDAVLDLAASADVQKQLMRTLAAIVAPPGSTNPGSQSSFTRSSGEQGVIYRRADWPDHMELAWSSSPGHFTIALGSGTLERSRSALDGHSVHRPDIRAQVDLIRAQRGGAAPLFQFGLDVSKLREGLAAQAESSPTPSKDGRVARLLRAWRLSNARSFMLHAHVIAPEHVRTSLSLEHLEPGAEAPPRTYFGPPLIVLDATWSARSEAPEHIGHASLTEAGWPVPALRLQPPLPLVDDPTAPTPPGPAPNTSVPRAAFALVLRNDLRSAFDDFTGFYDGLLPRDQGIAFQRTLANWERSAGAILHRQAKRLGTHTVILGPDKPLSIFSGISFIASLDNRADASSFDRDLITMLAPLKMQLGRSDDSPIRTLATPDMGLVNLAAWSVIPRTRDRQGVWIGAVGLNLSDTAARRRIESLSTWVQSK